MAEWIKTDSDFTNRKYTSVLVTPLDYQLISWRIKVKNKDLPDYHYDQENPTNVHGCGKNCTILKKHIKEVGLKQSIKRIRNGQKTN